MRETWDLKINVAIVTKNSFDPKLSEKQIDSIFIDDD